MLLTHIGSCPGVGLSCQGQSRWLRRGIGDVGGLALTPTVTEQLGAVAWRGLTHHLRLPREDPVCDGYLDRVRGDASSWMSVSLRSL